MEVPERDSTQDWLLPEDSAPPLLSELERRIDEAIAVARVSEARSIAVEGAVTTVGAAAFQAAEQARRAAGIAERAATAALDAQRRVQHSAPPPPPPLEDESLRSFTERADRIARRLRELERVPAFAGAEAAR